MFPSASFRAGRRKMAPNSKSDSHAASARKGRTRLGRAKLAMMRGATAAAWLPRALGGAVLKFAPLRGEASGGGGRRRRRRGRAFVFLSPCCLPVPSRLIEACLPRSLGGGAGRGLKVACPREGGSQRGAKLGLAEELQLQPLQPSPAPSSPWQAMRPPSGTGQAQAGHINTAPEGRPGPDRKGMRTETHFRRCGARGFELPGLWRPDPRGAE